MQAVVDNSFLFGRNALFPMMVSKNDRKKSYLELKVRIAAFGNIEELAAERSDEIRVFTFRIHDYYFIIGRKEHIHHFPLCAERLTGAGAAENKSIGVYKACTVEDDQIVGGLI